MRALVVTNMYPSSERPACGTFIEQQVAGLRKQGLEIEVAHLDRLRLGSKVYAKMRPVLEDSVRRCDPHLIAVMYGGPMAYQVTRAGMGRPVLVSFCGTDLLGENYSGLWRKCVSQVSLKFSRLAAVAADGIVVKSSNLRRALPPGILNSKVKIIPNGVDLEKFRPMPRQECQATLGWGAGFHVLFAANTGDPVKRPELAVGAIEILRKAGVPVVLHEMKAVEHAMVPVWLNAADALLLTSRQEGSPNIVKEALACNRPVVSTDVGDVAERMAGISGCFLAQPNIADVAGKLMDVFRGDREVDAREAMEKISLKSVSRELAAFYGQVVDGWHKSKSVHV